MEITGRLTANAEVRETKGDKKVTGFTIAMNRSYMKDGERVEISTDTCLYNLTIYAIARQYSCSNTLTLRL